MPWNLLLASFSILWLSCSAPAIQSSSQHPPSHARLDSLLKKHVDDRGWVNYQRFIQDSTILNKYLVCLSNHPPGPAWTEKEELAYWINAYNGFTIQLILRHFPVESIKDIVSGIQIPFVRSPFDLKFITIGGQQLDLNNIEHGIIREKFDEPRIHFALVCAAVSCPALRNEAYTAEQLDKQLTEQAKRFLAHPQKNIITQNQVEISKIFKWYRGDFTENGTLIEYLNRYASTVIDEQAEIDFLDYDWRLNSQTRP